MNRRLALNNVHYTCPPGACFLENAHQNSARLFSIQNFELLSEEGTTQGDNLSMAFYALPLVPMIKKIENANICQQSYADDASALGKLFEMKSWQKINALGPKLGFFPNVSEGWPIVKDEATFERAKLISNNTNTNISIKDHNNLGAFIGSEEGKDSNIQKKDRRVN